MQYGFYSNIDFEVSIKKFYDKVDELARHNFGPALKNVSVTGHSYHGKMIIDFMAYHNEISLEDFEAASKQTINEMSDILEKFNIRLNYKPRDIQYKNAWIMQVFDFTLSVIDDKKQVGTSKDIARTMFIRVQNRKIWEDAINKASNDIFKGYTPKISGDESIVLISLKLNEDECLEVFGTKDSQEIEKEIENSSKKYADAVKKIMQPGMKIRTRFSKPRIDDGDLYTQIVLDIRR